jgi:putative MATE family efflux protein
MFNKKTLYRLIVPLIIEQFLAVTVGMADTIMIAVRGEEAVSGISLVDTISILLIGLFAALATGGAVVVAQYIGHKDYKNGKIAANQLLLSVAVLATFVLVIALVGNKAILALIYGDVDPLIMHNARIYFYLSTFSYPCIALYSAGAALFRAMGNSKISMKVSLYMNGINIIGNAILIFGFGMGVSGAGISTLLSRAVAAVVVINLLRNQNNLISIDRRLRFGYQPKMIRRILRIGIPNGLENSMFQFGKILVSGLVAEFGTIGITANAVGNTVANFNCIPGSAIGLAMITVVGQCVGAGDLEQAKKSTYRLLKYAIYTMLVLNLIMILIMPQVVGLFHLKAATYELALKLLIYHCICCILIWPLSFTLPNALRAANDVKFTMTVSIISMWIFRVVLSFILANNLGLGVFGVWVAMTIDWVFRSILFVGRLISGRWKKHAYVSTAD